MQQNRKAELVLLFVDPPVGEGDLYRHKTGDLPFRATGLFFWVFDF